MKTRDIVHQLRSYRNGVHGAFFLEAAALLEKLDEDNTELIGTVHSLRNAIKEMNVRSIVNTKHVEIFTEIRTVINQVREMGTMPTAACNTIGTLLDIIDEEASNNGKPS
jgi:hypothetical protein